VRRAPRQVAARQRQRRGAADQDREHEHAALPPTATEKGVHELRTAEELFETSAGSPRPAEGECKAWIERKDQHDGDRCQQEKDAAEIERKAGRASCIERLLVGGGFGRGRSCQPRFARQGVRIPVVGNDDRQRDQQQDHAQPPAKLGWKLVPTCWAISMGKGQHVGAGHQRGVT